MNTDIRLSVEFWQHPKTFRLEKKIGLKGVRSLQILWCWCAKNRPDGKLDGLEVDEIEFVADWRGKKGAFMDACVGSWIDLTDSGYCLHEWAEYNPYQAQAVSREEARREKARNAATSKWGSDTQTDERQTRSQRLSEARKKSAHTNAEWAEMVDFFGNVCVRCGLPVDRPVKDHIIPIYRGGCDGIRNLQPLCPSCNSSKGPETTDFRIAYTARINKKMPAKWLHNACEMPANACENACKNACEMPPLPVPVPVPEELKEYSASQADAVHSPPMSEEAETATCARKRPKREKPPEGPAYRSKKGRWLSGESLASFMRFWEAFDFAKGKAEAADAWLDIPGLDEGLAARICEAAREEARGRDRLLEKGGTPKWAQGWLAARRWEDYEPGARAPLPRASPRKEPEMTEEERLRANAAREKAMLAFRKGKSPARPPGEGGAEKASGILNRVFSGEGRAV